FAKANIAHPLPRNEDRGVGATRASLRPRRLRATGRPQRHHEDQRHDSDPNTVDRAAVSHDASNRKTGAPLGRGHSPALAHATQVISAATAETEADSSPAMPYLEQQRYACSSRAQVEAAGVGMALGL